MLTSFDEKAARLAGRLRDLRKATGLSGVDFGAQFGWTQSKVSKIELGRTLPSSADVHAWTAATNASQADQDELVGMAEELVPLQKEWQYKFRRGQAVTQDEYDQMARNAKMVRNFETAAIPGLLQTADYGRYRTLEGVRRQGADPRRVEEAVAARVQRSQVLFDSARRFEFLLAEPVLRWRLAAPAVMRAQLARLITLSELPNVTIAILPFGVDLEDTPQHGFVLFDDLAVIETLSNEEKYPGDDKAAMYLSLFTDYMSLAIEGDQVRDFITAAIVALPST